MLAFISRQNEWTRLKGQTTVEAKRGKIIPRNICNNIIRNIDISEVD